MSADLKLKTYNPGGSVRVACTSEIPGTQWLDLLTGAGFKVDLYSSLETLTTAQLVEVIGDSCAGVIGQLPEDWNDELFTILKKAGGRVYSNYAVGYNNIDLDAATGQGIYVGNTPDVLTRTTAELAAALSFAAARKVIEGDTFIREGRFNRFVSGLFMGDFLGSQTLGIIGAGRIGQALAKVMVRGCNMNLIYHGPNRKKELEDWVKAFNEFLDSQGEEGVTVTYAPTLEELLENSDLVSLHTPLFDSTRHLISGDELDMMKPGAVLVNTSRGPIIDEKALVSHLKANPDFRAGLDVFEDEPLLAKGLVSLPNVVMTPHIGSATRFARSGMALLASLNVLGVLSDYPLWEGKDVMPFLNDPPPKAIPSIVNAEALGLK